MTREGGNTGAWPEGRDLRPAANGAGAKKGSAPPCRPAQSPAPEALRYAPSPRQFAVLRFIAEHVTEHGYPPTLVEICDALGIVSRSTNAAAQHIDALVRKGLVKRTPMTSRGLAITAAGKEFLESDRASEGGS